MRHCAEHTAKRRLDAARAGRRTRTLRARSPAGENPPSDAALGPAGRRAERALDGARDYGHRFREQGRFGSFSAYDDYGEDSGA
jgi:hypothetical protein